MAFAALGAAEVVDADPEHTVALRLLADAAAVIDPPTDEPVRPWLEPRLSYANAVLPDALLAAGSALGRDELIQRGLDLLSWLVDRELIDGHLSVTPAGGAAVDGPAPDGDQQPIEVATLADACARAARLTDDPRWTRVVAASVAWFLGANDGGVVMWDPSTGGGYDGLQALGPNRNEGAESTLALLSTLQHARTLAPVMA